MAYNISLSNGEPLVTIADGTVDVNFTSLSLIGKNFAGYGKLMNENFVHLLENFSNADEPVNPIVGQLWYDSGNKVVKIYTVNEIWKVLGSSTAGVTPPEDPVVGDQWWDTVNEQLNSWTGTSWKLVGPLWKLSQNLTGAIPDTVRDSFGLDHVVIKFYVNNVVTAIWSKEEIPYTVRDADKVVGFYTGSGAHIVKPGLTLANLGNYDVEDYTDIPRNLLWGTAENSLKLNGISPDKFLRRDDIGEVQTVAGPVEFTDIEVTGNLIGDITSSGTSTFNNATVTGKFIQSYQNGITATGTTQVNATQLTKTINVVGTVLNGRGVRLPVAIPGIILYIVNAGENNLKIYPASNEMINMLGLNKPLVLTPGSGVQFVTAAPTQWYTMSGAGGSTYVLTRSAGAVNEGGSVTITLTSTNVANGTLVPYTITGVTSADISGASLTGNFTVNNNSATLTLTIANDVLTEGTEVLTISLDSPLVASTSVVINDTSTGGKK